MSYSRKDANLQATVALPNGIASANSVGIYLNNPAGFDFDDAELLIEAPALSTAQLPNTKTMTYVIEHDNVSTFASATVLHAAALLQTGAGGAGAVAATQRIALPSNVKSYVRLKATNSGTGNASAASATVSVLT